MPLEQQRQYFGWKWYKRCVCAALLLIGLSMIVGGIALLAAGGSLYYLIAGVLVSVSGILTFRGNPRGAWIYSAMLAGTVAWSIWEVGFNGWDLLPRVVAPFVLGLAFIPLSRRQSAASPLKAPTGQPVMKIAGSFVAATLVGALLHLLSPAAPADPLWQTGAQIGAPPQSQQTQFPIGNGDWQAYGNDQGGTRFSPLDQIDAGNVNKLDVAWTADTGTGPAGAFTGGLEVTPIMIGDSLYICNGYDAVVAFDAETGKQRWKFAMSDSSSGKPCRGVAYYRVPGASGPCSERIYASSQVPDLVALDARTGRPCAGFGRNGRASLRAGMSPAPFGL